MGPLILTFKVHTVPCTKSRISWRASPVTLGLYIALQFSDRITPGKAELSSTPVTALSNSVLSNAT